MLTKNKSCGFSLVESLVVLAILALAAAAAMVHLSDYRSAERLRSETERIRLLLEHAALASLSAQQRVEVTLLPPALIVRYTDGPIITRHPIQEGFILHRGAPDRDRLLFHPTATASPATLGLEAGGRRCTIVVSLRTRVSVSC